ncbi:hypothetical protein MIR68_000844 [Amoeboaphelidium protococcarum]|nr:hypothetical protein MIR68_000844 [Amoeboaphelidium protococcarum]
MQSELNLDELRKILVRLEDTIIFALIERAQFAHNRCIYESAHENFKNLPKIYENFQPCFLQYLLYELECVHAKVRRYTDEHPFTPHTQLPAPILPPLQVQSLLHESQTRVNVNDQIYQAYVQYVVPSISREQDDGHYGSSATRDVECLQALSKRIHYGKHIAESKYRDNPTEYQRLIDRDDQDSIYRLLTNEKVEEKLLERVREKASVYGQDFSSFGSEKINEDTVVEIYKNIIIPLTKEVEVEYLMQRVSPK